MSDGLLRFMRAHGQRPAPGQRPRTAGALAGSCAGLVALPVLLGSGGGTSVADALGVASAAVAAMYVAVITIGGAVYGAVFGRAASDRRGGWLFGISYGFLIWMVGPITLLRTVLGHPLAVGTAAMGVLAAHLLSGLLLGVLFRPMHGVVQRIGKRAAQPQPTPAARIGLPHAGRAHDA